MTAVNAGALAKRLIFHEQNFVVVVTNVKIPLSTFNDDGQFRKPDECTKDNLEKQTIVHRRNSKILKNTYSKLKNLAEYKGSD